MGTVTLPEMVCVQFVPWLCAQGVMLASVLSARQVDQFVARRQRQQLGLCEECGGLYDPASCAQGKCPSLMRSAADKAGEVKQLGAGERDPGP